MIEIYKNKITSSLGTSKYLQKIASYYVLAPSAIIIRTAEAELFSALPLEAPILDLCCGDGYFSFLISPGVIDAACDLSFPSLRKAAKRGKYRQIVCADVTKGIPFRDRSFQTVVSNSALEHVRDINNTLKEIARILKPGGKLYTTFASNYAYEWWTCGQNAMQKYFNFQPVYNYFSLQGWEQRMAEVGLQVMKHQYYLSKRITRLLLCLDYHFSRVYLTSDRTIYRYLIRGMRFIPKLILAEFWRRLFSRVAICQEEMGGGILIVAERKN